MVGRRKQTGVPRRRKRETASGDGRHKVRSTLYLGTQTPNYSFPSGRVASRRRAATGVAKNQHGNPCQFLASRVRRRRVVERGNRSTMVRPPLALCRWHPCRWPQRSNLCIPKSTAKSRAPRRARSGMLWPATFRSAVGDWADCWTRHYTTPSVRPLMLVVRDARQRLVGLAPLCLTRSALRGRVISFIGSGMVCSDYLSLLAYENKTNDVACVVADWLATNGGRNLGSLGTRRRRAIRSSGDGAGRFVAPSRTRC